MKIVVCVRQGLDGDINPFDASAYEEALRIEGAEVTLLSMGPPSAKDMLTRLTRLGAREAILLSDPRFAGADTLATAYTLSLAVKRLSPELVFCGRQTLVGDTGQTGIMLASMLGYSLITSVMKITALSDSEITAETRDEGTLSASFPALLTFERTRELRLPRLRSKPTECSILDAASLSGDESRFGLSGSPTRVVSTTESRTGLRKCVFISKDDLPRVIGEALAKPSCVERELASDGAILDRVVSVGEAPLGFARTVSAEPTVIPLTDAMDIADRIAEL